MLLLSQPGVYHFRKLLFANNFQFFSRLNQVFSGNSLCCILHLAEWPLLCWLSGGLLYAMAGPWSPVSPPAYIETDTEVTINPNSLTPSLSESSKCVTCLGGWLRMKHSLVTFINPLIPSFPTDNPHSTPHQTPQSPIALTFSSH